MHVSLTPELEEMIKAHVATGHYNSSSELVREALRTWLNEQEYKKKMDVLRAKLAIGEEQAKRGEFSDKSLEEFLTDVKVKRKDDTQKI